MYLKIRAVGDGENTSKEVAARQFDVTPRGFRSAVTKEGSLLHYQEDSGV